MYVTNLFLLGTTQYIYEELLRRNFYGGIFCFWGSDCVLRRAAPLKSLIETVAIGEEKA